MKQKRKKEKATLSSISKSIEKLATKDDLEKSIEKLAVITAHGFETTVVKTEFTEFKNDMTEFAQKTAVTLFNMDSELQTVDQRLDSIEKTLGPLVYVQMPSNGNCANIMNESRALNIKLAWLINKK